MNKLVIIRGPSGSGKSTIAANCMYQNEQGESCPGEIYETDRFWELNGEYNFNATKLGSAHNWNQTNVRTACHFGVELVVVANTNMTMWEMKPYIDIAAEFGYDVKVIRTPGPWEAATLFVRNIHGVPLATIHKQISKYQPYEGEVEWTDTSIFQA